MQPDDEVLFIDDVAGILRTSTRTIKRQLRAGTFFIPQLPRVDHRRRWSRQVVREAIATNGASVAAGPPKRR